MSLDIRTAVYYLSIVGLLVAMSMTAAAGRYPPTIRGTRHWAVGAWLVFLGFGLVFLQGRIPALLSIPIATATLQGACVAFYWAILLFRGRRLRVAFGVSSVLAAFALSAYFWAVVDRPASRIVAASMTAIPFCAAAAYEVLRRDPSGRRPPRIYTVTSGGLIFVGLALAARVGHSLFSASPTATSFSGNWVQYLVFTSYIVLVLLSFGFLLMCNDRLNEELVRLATLDPLTEAFNRRTIEDLLRKEDSRSRRSGTPLSVVMVDVDHFKRVNDEHGHAAGDAALVHVVGVMERELRTEDLVGRFGGEEFLVVLPSATEEEAAAAAERLRDRIAREPLRTDEAVLALTVSAGVATLEPAKETCERLLRRADAALYEAKRGGRNRVGSAVAG